MREIEVSGRAVLACGSCGERLVLLAATGDWDREGRASFECAGCGREVTMVDRVGEVQHGDLAPSQ